MYLLLAACSSHIPPEIKQDVIDNPGIEQVRNQPDAYMSRKVRWGGIILNTENKQNISRVTIVAFPLSESGEPRTSEPSKGRFVASIDKFLEPLVYSKDREITVTGNIIGTETMKIGEFPYEHPVVQVEHRYLWPEEPEYTDNNYPPYWYDPWYHPYYPWPYPYYPPRYFR